MPMHQYAAGFGPSASLLLAFFSFDGAGAGIPKFGTLGAETFRCRLLYDRLVLLAKNEFCPDGVFTSRALHPGQWLILGMVGPVPSVVRHRSQYHFLTRTGVRILGGS